jgi:magnesium-transporting ATPase (P-type)
LVLLKGAFDETLHKCSSVYWPTSKPLTSNVQHIDLHKLVDKVAAERTDLHMLEMQSIEALPAILDNSHPNSQLLSLDTPLIEESPEPPLNHSLHLSHHTLSHKSRSAISQNNPDKPAAASLSAEEVNYVSMRAHLQRMVARLNAAGLRVVAVAAKRLNDKQTDTHKQQQQQQQCPPSTNAPTGLSSTVGSALVAVAASSTASEASSLPSVHVEPGTCSPSVPPASSPSPSPSPSSQSVESDLVLIGLLCFLDQPKTDAFDALSDLLRANVQVKVLTGDSYLVARQVCEQLHLHKFTKHPQLQNNTQTQQPPIDIEMGKMQHRQSYTLPTLTGADMALLTDDDDDPQLLDLFRKTVLFAQLTPEDKAR